MHVIVLANKEELREMGVNQVELLRNVLEDLDQARDYSGFKVEVIIIPEEAVSIDLPTIGLTNFNW